MSETAPSTVLVVDDETDHADVMSEALLRQGFRTHVAHDLPGAMKLLEKHRFDVIVTDLAMDQPRDGLTLLSHAQKLTPPPPVILVTAHNDVPTSKEALKQGAYDYIVKPLDLDEFRAQVLRASERSQLKQQNEILEARLNEQGGFENIIGRSQAMQQVVRTARQVASSDIPVLILGESGTGKELIARAIHDNSRRRKARYVALNCAAFNESLLEGQLFGHVRGAFTNAISDHEGVFEHANRGSVFLDEIGDMPTSMQAKLLRVLENGEVVRVGSNEPRRVDVRLISATNRDVESMVSDKSFREDLYYRIKGVSIRLPPLRERREDIPLLVYFFLKQTAKKYDKEIDAVTADAQQLLMGYHWPGNVRQLQRTIETACVMSSGPMIRPEDLPAEVRPTSTAGGSSSLVGQTMEQIEREAIRQALDATGGNREQASKMLGMGERTLYRKIKEYNL